MKKLMFLGLLGMLTTMMTSCLVVFPDEYEYDYTYDSGYTSTSTSKYSSYGTVVVTNNIPGTYISEISYGTDCGSASKWFYAWNDGHEYVYRSASSDYYYGTCNGNVYTCKMPSGYQDIRVTVIYPECNGTYTYEDIIFDDEYVNKNSTLYLSVNKNYNNCPR